MTSAKPLYVVHHQPPSFARRSGFPALLEHIHARDLDFDMTWQKLEAKSWRLGHALRQWGIRHYGSQWNALVPYLDEWRLSGHVSEREGAVIHFIWGEFASPRHPRWFRKKGNRLVATFHCSIRRLPAVLRDFRCWDSFDAWSCTSRTQLPFFLEHGVRPEDIRVVPLGVDTDYFTPDPAWRAQDEGPLRAIMVGKTERDHEFLVEVMKALPPGCVELSVCTHASYHALYGSAPGVKILPHIPDSQLLCEYQTAELMIMPFLDCTTNDAIMESMACGTPVMTNSIGGVPEYVRTDCNVVMDGKNVADWANRLVDLKQNRAALHAMRGPTRAWAETFGWNLVASEYLDLYEGRPSRR